VAVGLVEAASNTLYVSPALSRDGQTPGFADLQAAAATLERFDSVLVAAPYQAFAPGDVEIRRLPPSTSTHPIPVKADIVVCDSRYPERLGGQVAMGGPLTLMDNSWGGVVAVLGSHAAELLNVADTDADTVVWVNQHQVAVTALLAPSGNEGLDGAVLLSPQATGLLGSGASPKVLVGTIAGRAEALEDAIPMALSPDNPGGVEVSVPSGLASLQGKVASDLSGLMSTLGWVILALAAMSAATSMLLSIHQRAPEVALRRAVGASRWAIWRGFMTEGALIGLAGGLVGALLGVAGTIWMARARGWTPTVGLQLPLTAVLLGLATAILAAALPAAHAAHRNPAVLLRGT
jgi:macrolide transport system ATP-binding/permease protein